MERKRYFAAILFKSRGTGYNWELYHVAEDPTEADDLAAKLPDKLKELQELFYAEARKHDVLPLDNSLLARWNTPRPSLTAGRKVFTYSGELSGVPGSGAPRILDKAYTITAEVEIPGSGAEGMIVTEGGRFGGYGLFLSKGEFGFNRGKRLAAAVRNASNDRLWRRRQGSRSRTR